MTDLEREYSPSSRAGGSAEPYLAGWRARSGRAADELVDLVHDVGGGTLLVVAEPAAPLLVFVHGGYWQALSAADSLFLATPALAHGWSFAAVEYTLAPAAGLQHMVEECVAALAALAGSSLARPASVVLAGHSAGAHLAAMASVVHAAPFPVARTVLVSGVFDLRPLVHTTVNDPLGLDDEGAAALSPQLLPVRGTHEVVVAWGDHDTDAFAAQSRAYAARVGAAGAPVAMLECRGRHHFDIVDDLVDPSTALGRLAFGDD